MADATPEAKVEALFSDHPRLFLNIERTTRREPYIPEGWKPSFTQWLGQRSVRFTLRGVSPPYQAEAVKLWRSKVAAFASDLGLKQLGTKPFKAYSSPEVLAILDVNTAVLHTTTVEAAIAALHAGRFTPRTLQRGRRVWSNDALSPLSPGEVIARYHDDETQCTASTVLDRQGTIAAIHTRTEGPRGVEERTFLNNESALADPRVASLDLTPRGRIHGLHHLSVLDRAQERNPEHSQLVEKSLADMMKVDVDIEALVVAPHIERLIDQAQRLHHRFGHLAWEPGGMLLHSLEAPEIWRLDCFVSPADEEAAIDSPYAIAIHMGSFWCPPYCELQAIDEQGRFWGYRWGQEDWFLLAESAEIWLERLVRFATCTWSSYWDGLRRPDAMVSELLGERWAEEHHCSLVPEACDRVANLWENDELVIVADRFRKTTCLWRLEPAL